VRDNGQSLDSNNNNGMRIVDSMKFFVPFETVGVATRLIMRVIISVIIIIGTT